MAELSPQTGSSDDHHDKHRGDERAMALLTVY